MPGPSFDLKGMQGRAVRSCVGAPLLLHAGSFYHLLQAFEESDLRGVREDSGAARLLLSESSPPLLARS